MPSGVFERTLRVISTAALVVVAFRVCLTLPTMDECVALSVRVSELERAAVRIDARNEQARMALMKMLADLQDSANRIERATQ